TRRHDELDRAAAGFNGHGEIADVEEIARGIVELDRDLGVVGSGVVDGGGEGGGFDVGGPDGRAGRGEGAGDLELRAAGREDIEDDVADLGAADEIAGDGELGGVRAVRRVERGGVGGDGDLEWRAGGDGATGRVEGKPAAAVERVIRDAADVLGAGLVGRAGEGKRGLGRL